MSRYREYDQEQVDALLSRFMVNSWSYSKITSFARHEKAFEMNYIFGIYSRKSPTTIGGQAYHHALEYYFNQLKDNGEIVELPQMELSAFEYLDEIPSNQWKLSKSWPTVDDCRNQANESVTKLLRNFASEYQSEVMDDVAQVLAVELKLHEWITVNNEDIPMPCNLVIDRVVIMKKGGIAIIDDKSKTTFTDEEHVALAIGPQAITYVLGYEAATGNKVDEVWFVENKISKNKDGGKQIKNFKVVIDENSRALYEAQLYEPLKRMLMATSDPDYIYLINPNDNFVDKAEINDFWARTMLCEVDEFNVAPDKKEMVSYRLSKIRNASSKMVTPTVIKNFKQNAASFIKYDLSTTNMTNAQRIEHVLRTFNMPVQVAHEFIGYSSNTFLLEFSAGVKIASVYGKRLDIANALNVSNVRIPNELTVYDAKSYMAIEYAKKREKDLFFDPTLVEKMRIPLGRDNFDNLIVWDLNNHSTPHMLVCGATGSGKSVLVKVVIESARILKLSEITIFDPKFEFMAYNQISGITVVNEIPEIEKFMQQQVDYMNKLVADGKVVMRTIIFDEFADAVAQANKGSRLEENMRILLQKGRSSGLRILGATQRASVKVITGDAKVNFPVQICFRVPKEIDSKVVLDEAGAESLSGRGDGLIKSPEYIGTVRFQAFYVPPYGETNTTIVCNHSSSFEDAEIID